VFQGTTVNPGSTHEITRINSQNARIDSLGDRYNPYPLKIPAILLHSDQFDKTDPLENKGSQDLTKFSIRFL
jgi:hypothetical protein